MPKKNVVNVEELVEEVESEMTDEDFEQFCRERDEEERRDAQARKKAYLNRKWFAFRVRLPESFIGRKYIQTQIMKRGLIQRNGGKGEYYTISCPVEEDAIFLMRWIRLTRVSHFNGFGCKNVEAFKRKVAYKDPKRAYFVGNWIGEVAGLGWEMMMDDVFRKFWGDPPKVKNLYGLPDR